MTTKQDMTQALKDLDKRASMLGLIRTAMLADHLRRNLENDNYKPEQVYTDILRIEAGIKRIEGK